MDNFAATGVNLNKGENLCSLERIAVPHFNKDRFSELTRSVRDKLANLAAKTAQPFTAEVLQLPEVSAKKPKVPKESNGGGVKKPESKKKANAKAKKERSKAENFARHQEMAENKRVGQGKKIYTPPFPNRINPLPNRINPPTEGNIQEIIKRVPQLLNALAATIEAFSK